MPVMKCDVDASREILGVEQVDTDGHILDLTVMTHAAKFAAHREAETKRVVEMARQFADSLLGHQQMIRFADAIERGEHMKDG